MTHVDFLHFSAPLEMIIKHGTSVIELDTQLKVVAVQLEELGHALIADRVYDLRFAEEMPKDKLRFEVVNICAGMRRLVY